jgi:hexosaminidase
MLIPKPISLIENNDKFELTPQTVIESNTPAGDLLAEYLRPATGYPLPIVPAAGAGQPAIIFQINSAVKGGDEAYRLDVNGDGINLRAAAEAGLLMGIQTLRQLLPADIYSPEVVSGVTWAFPGVVIEDAPRFGWRGGMLDVSRHFFDAATVKRYIDLLAMHKLNRFHWHLTDDQGWRIEIKRYPKLTGIGAWRKETIIGHPQRALPHRYDGQPHGGFYTQDEIRDVVAYAARRGIAIIPEIEMPGHAQAAIAAYPELGNRDTPLEVGTIWGIIENVFNAEETTIEFLQNVLREVLELFPSVYIHVGGDECPKTQWNNSPKAQARMRELNLPDADALQSYFIRRMDTFLNAQGRVLVGWDEILEGGLAENAVVMSWRGETGGIAAAKAGHDVVMAPWDTTYFILDQLESHQSDTTMGVTTLEKVYGYEPIPAGLTADEAKHVLGAQGQLWTEYMPTIEKSEFMAFPRMCALAEGVWTREKSTYADFVARLRAHLRRLDRLGVGYCGEGV